MRMPLRSFHTVRESKQRAEFRALVRHSAQRDGGSVLECASPLALSMPGILATRKNIFGRIRLRTLFLPEMRQRANPGANANSPAF